MTVHVACLMECEEQLITRLKEDFLKSFCIWGFFVLYFFVLYVFVNVFVFLE